MSSRIFGVIVDVSASEGGQLLVDLVQAYTKKKEGADEVIEWVFDKRSTDMIDEYVDVVKKALKGDAGEKVREALGKSLKEWGDDESGILADILEIVSNDFFRVIN